MVASGGNPAARLMAPAQFPVIVASCPYKRSSKASESAPFWCGSAIKIDRGHAGDIAESMGGVFGRTGEVWRLGSDPSPQRETSEW